MMRSVLLCNKITPIPLKLYLGKGTGAVAAKRAPLSIRLRCKAPIRFFRNKA